MAGQTILISGTPRSGTTLTCYLLTKLPDVVALHEPMQPKSFGKAANLAGIAEVVADFATAQRESILTEGVAFSKNAEGKVPDNPISRTTSGNQLRESLVSRGQIAVEAPANPDFTLVIKHNASFAAAIAGLAPRFPFFAVVRNPLATLSSWSTVKIPVQQGRVPVAEKIDQALKGRLDAEPDTLERQLILLDWFYRQYLDHLPATSIIKYEDVVDSQGRALAVVVPEARDLAEPLASQNRSKLYDPAAMTRLGERLLASDGAYWRLYDRASVEAILADVRAA